MAFFCNLLIPAIMTAAGYWMYKAPPHKINHLFGYRTPRSKKNADTWAFAHETFGKLWIWLGAAILVVSALVQLPFAHSGDDTVGVMTMVLETAQIAVILGSIWWVERALKQTFDEEGRRR